MNLVRVCKILRIKEVLAKELTKDLERKNFSHSFTYDSIMEKIYYYVYNENNKIYYFLGFYFLIVDLKLEINLENMDINYIKKNILDAEYKFASDKDCKTYETYYSYCIDKDITEENVSKILRGSKTPKISNQNCYSNFDIKVIFSEKGFAVLNQYNINSNDKFERVLFLFVLSRAYILKSMTTIIEIADAYGKDNIEKMVELRDKFYAFDLKYFFNNPIKYEKHQIYEIWDILSKNYHLKQVHDEVKEQVSDLVSVIQDKYHYIQKKEDKRKDRILTIIGLLIGIVSIVSIWNDLKEVFSF